MVHATRWVLIVGAVPFAVLGLLFALIPDTAAWVDIHPTTGTARADVRAIFGGLQLGLAAFLLWTSRAPCRYQAGAVAMALVFSGMVGGRTLGVLVDGEPTLITGALLTAEAIGLLLALVAVRQTR